MKPFINGQRISIIPVNHTNKRPLIDEWGSYQERQATDEEITKWEEELHPQSWAIVLGDVSGRLFVVDVDSPIAEETVIGKFMRAFPKTYVVETSPGKRHFFFRDTSKTDLKTKGFLNKSLYNDDQLPHVDLKAGKGYVLLPGSRHPAGHTYQVLEQNEIAEVPYDVVVFILQTLNKHWPIVQRVRTFYTSGGRNQICVGLAAFLFHHGFTVEEAVVLLQAVYYAASDTGDLHKAIEDITRTFSIAEQGSEVSYKNFLPPLLIDALQALDKRYQFSNLRLEREKARIEQELKSKLTEKKPKGPEPETEKPTEKPFPEAEKEELDPQVMQWLETATYEDVRNILMQHVKLPDEAAYDEVLLLSNQSRLMKILPVDSVVYVGVLGEFSSAKTYLTKIITFLADGEMVVDPTPAYILRQIGLNPGMTLGIDEVDQLVKDRNNAIIVSILRMGNTWEAWRGFVEEAQKGKGKIPVKINIGGPKVFNGYDSIDKALLSRTLTIHMKRWRDIDMVIEKMLGHKKLKLVRVWLQHRCEQALTTWNPDLVEQFMRSDEYKKTVDTLTKEIEVPRSMEIVGLILLLGKIMDIDTRRIIEHYIEGLDHTPAQFDIYKDFLNDVYRALISGGWTSEPKVYGFSTDYEAGGTPWRMNGDKRLEVQTTYLWKTMSIKLQEANRTSAINERNWYHVLSELGFSKDANWLKETKRGAWRKKWYLVFDDRILKTLGVIE